MGDGSPRAPAGRGLTDLDEITVACGSHCDPVVRQMLREKQAVIQST